MENLLRRFQELYSRVGDQAAAWDAEVQHGAKLIGAIASAIDNLQRLYDCKTVADTPLDSPEYGTPFLRKVQGRAAAGVGILLKELQNSLSRLKQITFQIDKASLDGTQVLSTAAETRSVETLLTARGSSPSLSQCANVRTRTLSQ
mmetsp:Transcript_9632/g.35296  ORF Transcript_9632/g.35296 Transcript_9632/m.35296 type:complete len:146 (+) Transcript_9632:45-482(+)